MSPSTLPLAHFAFNTNSYQHHKRFYVEVDYMSSKKEFFYCTILCVFFFTELCVNREWVHGRLTVRGDLELCAALS